MRLSYMCGVISRADVLRFKRLIFRASKGLCWVTFYDIDEKEQNFANNPKMKEVIEFTKRKHEPNSAFLILYKGGAYGVLKQKMEKICNSFGTST